MEIAITVIIVLLLVLYFVIRHYKRRIIKLQASYEHGLKTQSKEVAGKIYEKLLPLFEEYPYDLRDVIPIYDTFDFIVLNGKGNDNITEVVIQEIKTGQSTLSRRQIQLRNCIENKAVRFETWKRDSKTERFYLVKRQQH